MSHILIFCGNILVIICLLHKRNNASFRADSTSKHGRANIFILNLAFTDLMLSILIIPPNILQVILDNWIFGNAFCKVKYNDYFVKCYVSVLSVSSLYRSIKYNWWTRSDKENIGIRGQSVRPLVSLINQRLHNS